MLLEPSKFTGIEKFGDYWKIKKGNKVGLFDALKKTVLIEPKYREVAEPFNFNGGILYPLMKANGKWGALNSYGIEVIKFKNENLSAFPVLKAIKVDNKNLGERLFFPEENRFLEVSSWNETSLGPFKRICGSVKFPSENTQGNILLQSSFTENPGYTYTQRRSGYKNFDLIIDAEGNLISLHNVFVKPLGSKWLIIYSSQPWMIYDEQGKEETKTILSGKQFSHSQTQGWYADQSHIIFLTLMFIILYIVAKICNLWIRMGREVGFQY